MKLSTNNTSFDTTITSAAEFGINDNDMSHIMGILRSQIYSDKLMAVIREYSTNAVDANIEAGKPDHAIQVHLPTIAEPYISFRDFGNGLSPDEVTQLYVRYGASTKRSSNDYTGCLGIGCKAGFAYGDTFTVISYRPDNITTWLARIDESKRGTISLLSTETNPNQYTGTEVRVSINKADIEDCTTKALNLFKYWKIKPICNYDHYELNIIEERDDWAIVESDENHNYRYGSTAKVVMGNIPYPIDRNQLKNPNVASQLLLSRNVVIKAPLGALDIAANRESLEYSQRTLDGLNAMANNMLVDLAANVNKSIKDAPTRLAASINSTKYNHIFEYNITNAIRKNCSWNGQELLHNIEFKDSNTVAHSRQKMWRSGDYRNKRDKDVRSTTLKTNMTLCVWDNAIMSEANATRRVRTLQANNNWDNNDIFYVIPASRLHHVVPSLTPNDYVDLSTIEPLKPARSKIVTTSNGKTKSVRINVCQLTPNQLKSARLSKEAEPKLDPISKKYVYVPLDRFDWLGHSDWLNHLEDIQRCLSYMLGITTTTPINGVKKHYVKKLDNNWITLDQYYSDVFNKYYIDHNENIELAMNATSHYRGCNWDSSTIALLQDCNNQRIAKLANALAIKNKSNILTQEKLCCRIAYIITNTPRRSYIEDELKYVQHNHALLNNIHYMHVYKSDNDYQAVLTDLNKLLA